MKALSQLLGPLDPARAYQAAVIARQGAHLAAALLLANSWFSPAQVGHYEQWLFLGYLLTSFWATGALQGFLTFFPSLGRSAQQRMAWTACGVLFAGAFAVSGVFWAFKGQLLPLFTGTKEVPGLGLYLLALCLNLSGFLLEHLLLVFRRSRMLLGQSLLFAAGHLLAVAWGSWYAPALSHLAVALVLTGGCKLAMLGVVLAREAGWPCFEGRLARKWLSYAFPLMGYALIGALSLSFDSWLVGWHYEGDARTFAVFRYGARELPLALALAGAFGTAVLPLLSEDLGKGLAAMKSRAVRLFHLLFPFSIALLLSSGHWFPLLFGEEFRESVPLFNIFLLVLVSRLLFPRTVLMALGANRAVFWLGFLELGLNVFLGFWWVQWLGLAGVAWATVAAYTVDKLLMCAYLKARFGISWRAYTPTRHFAVYTTLMLGAYAVTACLGS
ncbi:lipopolysaccharide biosynthesis protein [Phaeodactylibacter luteus]|uniref:Uncharacterized protein n=1 Tax=Phaeodactylibacter luteus TaxID=1564516 RepID=A0A5C6RQB5_9BACT|nr:polysaccharide biosynthesis C-terminal domain-containing protein [Phaeodactylibacter luteus]TXB63582.1 hypothetical protein FRY97_08640 [Phaeodactylibacter luteus]